MKTTVLKRKALVLSMAMAFIGAITLTQCKKEPPIVTPTEDPTETPTDTVTTPEGEIVHITLRVNQSNDEKLDVDPPHVYFETGDVLHVVSNGVHVGVVTYIGSEFAGDISGATSGMPLDFYLLGNMDVNNSNITWTGEGDVKTGCSVNISTQTSSLPVISYAPSNENFTAGAEVQDFTAILHNKCALVKFNVIPSTFSDDITLQGTNLNDKVTVNFANNTTPFTYDHTLSDGGIINIGKRSDGYWAILLPHDGAITATASATGYSSATVTIPAINNNAYLNDGITVDFTTTNTSHTITVSANPNEGGSVSGGGDYLNSQSCTLTATANTGYAFDHWTLPNGSTSTVNPLTFTVDADATYVAHFVSYDPDATPLTFEAKTAGATVTFTKTTSLTLNDLEYNVYDGDGWRTYTSGTAITLTNVGDKVSFRGNNAKYAVSPSYFSYFSCTGQCYIYGNVMSLIDANNYPTVTELTSDNAYAFCVLFYNNANIYNHVSKALVLPATTLAESCYAYMFQNCSNLTSAPAMPATTLAESCYSNMFVGCSNLTSAPTELPATTLANHCYEYMFYGCTNLTAAPALPATTLAKSCYSNMFRDCNGLTTSPVLRATTLAETCYFWMFYNCANLNSVTCLATDISATNCTMNWLKNVKSTGTFTKASTMSSWPTEPDSYGNVIGIPFNWTVQNAPAP